MMDRSPATKALLAPLHAAMRDFDLETVRGLLSDVSAPDAVFRLCHPFSDLSGPEALVDRAYAPLLAAWPDLERRDWIVLSGVDADGAVWVGCGGHYLGSFVAPFLDIPPTGHLAHMRFHEFYRIERGRVVEMQAVWDIAEVMIHAGVWPMVPSLGREICVPGPATQDGLAISGDGRAARDHVVAMLTELSKHPLQGGPEIMQAERFWHPRVNWYGPAGIGTARGIAGFRNWHQIPFLKALPDRSGGPGAGYACAFMAEGAYVGCTGWPNMRMTLTGDGWLGLPPSGQEMTMRSLDFWRVEDGLIRENWVLIDLLDIYRQLGVDVFARLREFNKARVPGAVPYPVGVA